MTRKTEITIEEGSTNVYADLGYADAAEMQRKSQLAAEIARAIKARRLTQQDAAELLGIDQSKVSRITRGQFRGVSEAKLLDTQQIGRVLLGQSARLDRPGDFGRELGLALHFGGVGIAQVGVDVGAAFFDRDLGLAGHQQIGRAHV